MVLPSMSTVEEAEKVLQDLIARKKLSEADVRTSMINIGKRDIDNGEQVCNTALKKGAKAKKSSTRKQKDPFQNCRLRHIAMQIAYDGALYNGFAENVGSEGDNSVEKYLFAALRKCCLVKDRSSCGYTRCGRTDKGVSAFGQVIGLVVRSSVPLVNGNGEEIKEDALPKNNADELEVLIPRKRQDNKQRGKNCESGNESESPGNIALESKVFKEMDFCKMMNGVLPDEIRAIGWAPVTEDFSARFSAKDRTYRYFFAQRNLDVAAMRDGLARIIGNHDFRNLAKMDTEHVSNFCRLILGTKIVEGVTGGNEKGTGTRCNRQVSYFEIKGQAFLWHMIRCIVAVTFMVGKKIEDPSVFDELMDIDKNPGKPGYTMAPDLPLVLHNCDFHSVKLGYSAANLWEVTCHLEARWERLSLAAARARNALESLECDAHVRKDDLRGFVQNLLKSKNQTENILDFGSLCAGDGMIVWKDALDLVAQIGKRPTPEKERAHVNLMSRSRGTTYAEKISSMKGRKRGRYEENIKKQKSPEEDAMFYRKMAQQGGSGV